MVRYFGDFIDGRHLLYVPTGLNDPIVNFADGFDTDAFFAFLDETGLSGYAGSIAPRNAFNSGWWGTADLRIEQQFPAFREDHRFAGYITIQQLLQPVEQRLVHARGSQLPAYPGSCGHEHRRWCVPL